MLKLKIDWMDFEVAVESQSAEMTGYLDTKTGAVLVIAQETLDLHDDLRTVKLPPKTIATPPIDLWPTQQARVPVPEDVERLLLAPLREKTG